MLVVVDAAVIILWSRGSVCGARGQLQGHRGQTSLGPGSLGSHLALRLPP